ncbi:glyoxalase superfamily protein [Rhodococcus sp. UNC363MFTsu5.1]|uniref:glyoxalase superfamily protein n=1 Tax=Rhodococcus sp. UNC363MFTsu5.1 TaxID=1449069 RepID=UPI00048026C5|nr:glyoxalase superfamily protein [Rhodococcus sp. UNC363MFTsu5.1]
MDLRLQLVPLPVADVERAKSFYVDKAGFTLDHDHSAGDQFRVVQLTPPGSACSICFGIGIVDTTPGSVKGLHLVVDDIHGARAELAGRGVEMGEVEEMGAPGKPTVSYAAFTDPDGNSWTLQQISG